ncbi:hypothetical protein OJF2_45720 [Aquisphaera giovannonii]|uniref:Uncharacterized protein n=1 Tax=Aquisphaera giovannonii TaxID=406548 RepID=A0A5B9W6Z1_9BACT|nr:hypothetical protein [Aquisphaera giovannonii]QEH36014.1 hypothetical protein OJF2_45720 [Aquisphaera giovannonii]
MSTNKPVQEQPDKKKKEDETVHLSADDLRKISGGAGVATGPAPAPPKAPLPPTTH